MLKENTFVVQKKRVVLKSLWFLIAFERSFFYLSHSISCSYLEAFINATHKSYILPVCPFQIILYALSLLCFCCLHLSIRFLLLIISYVFYLPSLCMSARLIDDPECVCVFLCSYVFVCYYIKLFFKKIVDLIEFRFFIVFLLLCLMNV